MKIDSTFHVTTFLIIILIFGMPFIALAQQNSPQAEALLAAEQDVAANINQGLWFLGGCLGGPLALIFAYTYEPSPPASRLLGKSPEYVAFYTDAYKTKSSKLQTSRALTGCVVSSAVYLILSVRLASAGADTYTAIMDVY